MKAIIYSVKCCPDLFIFGKKKVDNLFLIHIGLNLCLVISVIW